jgi:hypothetical protein
MRNGGSAHLPDPNRFAASVTALCVASKEELKARILAYLDDLNREPVIRTWTYKIDTVT